MRFCSVIKNIAHLCGRTRSKTWGPDGWKKVVVCIVSDGRSKVNKRTLQVLSLVRTCTSTSVVALRLTLQFRWAATKKVSRKTRSLEGMSQPISLSSYPESDRVSRFTERRVAGTHPTSSLPTVARCRQDPVLSRSCSASRSRTRRS
jgi:hypothetical protein